ncbi:MAG: hypothetical protein ABSA12_15795 [Verrucomicrobiia bacterium]|jgi:hypothetical protein
MKTLVAIVVAALSLCPFATPSFAGSDVDRNLTKQISDILTECQKITPGMTRADLLKVFTTEGGLSSATHRTFVHRRCPYIKVDVEFAISGQKQPAIEGRSTDTIIRISKPYLDWSVID